MVLVPEAILGVFLTDPETLALAKWPLRISGATRTVMTVSVSVQWLLFLPAAFLVGPTLGHGLLGIWMCHVFWRAVQAAVFTSLWQRGRWAYVRV